MNFPKFHLVINWNQNGSDFHLNTHSVLKTIYPQIKNLAYIVLIIFYLLSNQVPISDFQSH